MKVHQLNEGYVCMSNIVCLTGWGVDLSLLHAFFCKLTFCSRPKRCWPFQIGRTRIAVRVLAKHPHAEITKMHSFGLTKMQERVFIRIRSSKFISSFELETNLENLSPISLGSPMYLCWKKSISEWIILHGGSSLRMYRPVAHLRIGK